MSDRILLCETHSDWCDINYALVTLSKEHIQWILGRMKVAEELKNSNGAFYSLEYFDSGTCSWYKDITEAKDLSDWAAVDCRPETGSQRTDLDTIVITNDSCYWTAHPKHADVTGVETLLLTIEQLRNLL